MSELTTTESCPFINETSCPYSNMGPIESCSWSGVPDIIVPGFCPIEVKKSDED